MHLLCVGISHQTAPVALRERLAYDRAGALAELRRLKASCPQAEMVLLSTCNRTELYVARPLHGHPRFVEVLDHWAEHRNLDRGDLEPAAYHHDNQAAIHHLLCVTSGVDSMVLGESEIVSQVKQAYEAAQEVEAVGPALHLVFQSALATSKTVRSETGIGEGRVSVGSVAVDFTSHLFSRFDDKTVLAIGAGEIMLPVLRHFLALGPGRLIICNRTRERAERVVAECGGQTAPWEQLAQQVVAADVIITSTASEEPVITAKMLRPLLKRRRFRPISIIDLAVPRDVDPAVNALDNVYVYNLDDLQKASEAAFAERRDEIEACERMVAQAAAECYAALQASDFNDLIRRLRERMHELGRQENERTANRLTAATPERVQEVLDEHTYRLLNKVLHRPISELGRADGSQAAMYATALRRLFDLDGRDDPGNGDRGACENRERP